MDVAIIIVKKYHFEFSILVCW